LNILHCQKIEKNNDDFYVNKCHFETSFFGFQQRSRSTLLNKMTEAEAPVRVLPSGKIYRQIFDAQVIV